MIPRRVNWKNQVYVFCVYKFFGSVGGVASLIILCIYSKFLWLDEGTCFLFIVTILWLEILAWPRSWCLFGTKSKNSFWVFNSKTPLYFYTFQNKIHFTFSLIIFLKHHNFKSKKSELDKKIYIWNLFIEIYKIRIIVTIFWVFFLECFWIGLKNFNQNQINFTFFFTLFNLFLIPQLKNSIK